MQDTPVLNVEQLESLKDLNEPGEPDVISELIDLFEGNSPKTLSDIHQAIVDEDRDSLVGFAHKMKGSSANLGAEQLRALCFHLEKSGQEISWEEAKEYKEKIDKAYIDAIAALKKDWYVEN